MYIVYIRDTHRFSLVCMFNKALKNLQVKEDVQWGALRFREKLDKRCASFIQYIFSSKWCVF